MLDIPSKVLLRRVGRGVVPLLGALFLALPAAVLAAPADPTVDVQRSPVVVFTMVVLLLGSVAAGLFFARPWRTALGPRPLTPEAAGQRHRRHGGLPWMPGGDVFQRETVNVNAAPVATPFGAPVSSSSASPTGQWPAPASVRGVRNAPATRNPWSTGQPGPAPRWSSGTES